MKTRPRIPPEIVKKTGETVDLRQNNGNVKAVSPRHCAATSAPRNCCFNCRAGQRHEDNVRCTAVEEQHEAKKVGLHLPAHDPFWANLRVQLHLPPLHLAWNPAHKPISYRILHAGMLTLGSRAEVPNTDEKDGGGGWGGEGGRA